MFFNLIEYKVHMMIGCVISSLAVIVMKQENETFLASGGRKAPRSI